MPKNTFTLAVIGALLAASIAGAQTNPIWGETKVKNYLPHMSWTEVEDLLTRTDMVIMPVGSLEQHGPHLPIGTDFLNGMERAKLVAQRTDVLVAPILFVGNAPYHLGFPGTVSLPAETIQQVYFEAARSLMRQGFKRFLILNSHGGNRVISQYIADRINHETEGIAVELGAASAPFRQETESEPSSEDPVFDRHGGVGETS
ncbi:MAG: creatininase family protein, partial [Acidobacteria bacterium]|nr:creatininase family protein [Acidobacteriota bacterium]